MLLHLPTRNAYATLPTPNDYAMPPPKLNGLRNYLKSSLLYKFHHFKKKRSSSEPRNKKTYDSPLNPGCFIRFRDAYFMGV